MWLSKAENRESVKNIRKVNRYLEYMERRLEILHKENNGTKINFVGCSLLKSSKSYQLCIFHRTRKNGYGRLSEKDAKKSLTKFMNKCRSWDLRLELERFYVSKPEGIRIEKDHVFLMDEKFRPIGCPSFESRMISKAFNDLIYFILRDDLTAFQHAYRLERGVHTALLEVWIRIVVKGHRHIREFDFKSFFNSINIAWVTGYLRTKSEHLAGLVVMMYDGIKYKFDRPIENIPKEAEIVVEENKRIPVINRNGLPQGLSLSPILATAVMGSLPKLEGLVMFADDGMIIREDSTNDIEVDGGFETLGKLGVNIDPKKSGIVKDHFKFLGVEFDLEKETVKYKESIFTGKGRDTQSLELAFEIYTGFKLVGQIYGKKAKDGNWNINPKSTIVNFRYGLRTVNLIGSGPSYVEKLKEMGRKLIEHRSFKGYRGFIGRGIYHVASSSTKCCERFLEFQKDQRLVKIKAFFGDVKPTEVGGTGKGWETHRRKGRYLDRRKNRIFMEGEDEMSSLTGGLDPTGYSMKERQAYLFKAIKRIECVPIRRIIIRRIQTNKYNLRGRKIKR